MKSEQTTVWARVEEVGKKRRDKHSLNRGRLPISSRLPSFLFFLFCLKAWWFLLVCFGGRMPIITSRERKELSPLSFNYRSSVGCRHIEWHNAFVLFLNITKQFDFCLKPATEYESALWIKLASYNPLLSFMKKMTKH